jgi:RNase H-fold protein (predicted Holliday junction resolvase)
MIILAIDPGKDKIGAALYDERMGTVVYHGIIPSDEFPRWLSRSMEEYQIGQFVLGDGTHSGSIQAHLQRLAPQCSITMVDEAYSTLEARKVYFQLYPPRGLKRLIPRSMQTPARPVDDLVAIVLLKRHLGDMPQIGIQNRIFLKDFRKV